MAGSNDPDEADFEGATLAGDVLPSATGGEQQGPFESGAATAGGGQNDLWCEICKKSMSRNALRAHNSGQRHRNALAAHRASQNQKAIAEAWNLPRDALPSAAGGEQQGPFELGAAVAEGGQIGMTLWCGLCNCILKKNLSRNALRAHNSSQRHKNILVARQASQDQKTIAEAWNE